MVPRLFRSARTERRFAIAGDDDVVPWILSALANIINVTGMGDMFLTSSRVYRGAHDSPPVGTEAPDLGCRLTFHQSLRFSPPLRAPRHRQRSEPRPRDGKGARGVSGANRSACKITEFRASSIDVAFALRKLLIASGFSLEIAENQHYDMQDRW
jgi:hypothetical protein